MFKKLLLLSFVMLTAGCTRVSGVYVGSFTQTFTAGGSTSTSTTTGETAYLIDSAEAGKVVIVIGWQDPGIVAKVDGSTLTADPGQTWQQQSSNTTSTISITSGTGSISDKSLSLTMMGTYSQTSGGTTQNATINTSFTGTKK